MLDKHPEFKNKKREFILNSLVKVGRGEGKLDKGLRLRGQQAVKVKQRRKSQKAREWSTEWAHRVGLVGQRGVGSRWRGGCEGSR